MGEVFTIHNRSGVFSLEEVRGILPIIRRITFDVSERTDELVTQLEATPAGDSAKSAVIEDEMNRLIHQWNEKVRKLGALPKGLWLVDFDFGRGYYCWKHPEPDILHWHTKDEGFSGRRPLEELKLEKAKSPHRSGPNQSPPRRF